MFDSGIGSSVLCVLIASLIVARMALARWPIPCIAIPRRAQ